MDGDALFRILFGAVLGLNFGIVSRFRARAQAGRRFDYSKEGKPLFLALRLSGLAVMVYCILYIIRPGLISWSLVAGPTWLRIAAAVFASAPVPAFIVWAQRNIGDNVSPTVTTREGQSLITSGPYAWIRNPLYVGGFCLLGSLAIISGSVLLAAAAFIALALVTLRLPAEEAELEARFGDEWRAYSARTGRFLPRLVNRSMVIITVLGVAAIGTTACESSPTDVQTLILYVSGEQVPCFGVGPRDCLLVREDPAEEWRLFYDPIEGFDWEPGFEYRLQVIRSSVKDPPADGSSFRYVLLEILEKKRT